MIRRLWPFRVFVEARELHLAALERATRASEQRSALLIRVLSRTRGEGSDLSDVGGDRSGS